MTQESQPAAGTPEPSAWKPLDRKLHHAVVADPQPETNQAERAAMRPEDDDDLSWHFYHGAWSG
jgi:hypothetical protein